MVTKYQLINSIMFIRYHNIVILRFLELFETYKILMELHYGPIGRHFASETTSHKIIHVG